MSAKGKVLTNNHNHEWETLRCGKLDRTRVPSYLGTYWLQCHALSEHICKLPSRQLFFDRGTLPTDITDQTFTDTANWGIVESLPLIVVVCEDPYQTFRPSLKPQRGTTSLRFDIFIPETFQCPQICFLVAGSCVSLSMFIPKSHVLSVATFPLAALLDSIPLTFHCEFMYYLYLYSTPLVTDLLYGHVYRMWLEVGLHAYSIAVVCQPSPVHETYPILIFDCVAFVLAPASAEGPNSVSLVSNAK